MIELLNGVFGLVPGYKITEQRRLINDHILYAIKTSKLLRQRLFCRYPVIG